MLSADQPNLPDSLLGPEDVGAALDVSRETLSRLTKFVDLLLKWQRSINLIGPGTLDDVWCRHVLDCGQLVRFLPDRRARARLCYAWSSQPSHHTPRPLTDMAARRDDEARAG